jgi:hypothetical protein
MEQQIIPFAKNVAILNEKREKRKALEGDTSQSIRKGRAKKDKVPNAI